MEGKWTGEQIKAITTKGCNLLVAAAAGAGKTAVLVERITRRITDSVNPVDVDRMLVVTFTNAAAAEMRMRIGSAIAGELAANPGSGRLHTQLALLNRARVTTLHSFCLDVLRQHFYSIDLDPNFRVADETETALLRLEVLEQIFEQRYSGGDPLFAALSDCYGSERDDGALMDLVLKLHDFSRSNPCPDRWLKEKAALFNLPEENGIDDNIWAREIKDVLSLELGAARAALERALAICSYPGGPSVYRDNLVDEIALVGALEAACTRNWHELHTGFGSLKFNKLGRAGKDVNENLKKQVRDLRESSKKRLEALRQLYFSRPPEEYIKDLASLAPVMETLAELTLEFGEVYQRAKLSRGLVDFSDLEHYCLKILAGESPCGGATTDQWIPSPVALELQEQFEEVLVDEYQDINPVQEAVLTLVSRQGGDGPNLFMVGDVKQSIYRFRLAEPGLFLHKYNSYSEGEGGPELKLDLSRNFRSRAGVLEAVNHIFRRIMTRRVGEMVYDHRAELVCGAEYPPAGENLYIASGTVEVHLIDRKNNSGENDLPGGGVGTDYAVENFTGLSLEAERSAPEEEPEAGEPDLIQMEARVAARRIRELVEGTGAGGRLHVYDRGTGAYRPVVFRDIVVLLRATRDWANIFLEEFRQSGVPAYAELGSGYFEAVEVETVLGLLKIIDNPRQDIPLAGVLRSPLVGLDAGELAEIAASFRGRDFYDALTNYARTGKGSLRDRAGEFLGRLDRWRTMARRGTLTQLIWGIYRESGYYDYVGGMPGGARRQANLRYLHDRARQFESTSLRGLFGFLRFIERFREEGNDLGAARTLGENENVVRVMSVHKSKGLEFPVVIVAGLGKKFNTRDLNSNILLHKKLGLGPDKVDPALRVSYPTLAKAAIRGRLKMESLAEEMRVLYVALTRAKEKLILVGSSRDLTKAATTWCRGTESSGAELPDAYLASAGCFLDWIGPALAGHPDGAPLRELAGAGHNLPEPPVSGASRWQVLLRGTPGGNDPEGKKSVEYTARLEKVRLRERVEAGTEEGARVASLLSWKYPYEALQGRAAKVSVTEIKRRFELLELEEGGAAAVIPPYTAAERRAHAAAGGGGAALHSRHSAIVSGRDRYRRPGFMAAEKGLTPAELGSAVHLVMQHLDLGGALDSGGVARQVALMEAQELLTPGQAKSVDVDRVAAFFCSPLGKRLLSAAGVRREVPFSLALGVREVYPELPETQASGETVLIQGVIDCLFREADGLVLVDYKTDRVVDAPDISAVADRYRGQLNLYARAVEVITGEKVKEKYLYLFSAGTVIPCLW